MKQKYALALLIGNNVRVINISMGSLSEKAIIERNSEIMAEFLNKLLNLGYDFVIVTSAGNISGNRPDDVLASENSAYNYIKHADVAKRIIVVGAMTHKDFRKVNGNIPLEKEDYIFLSRSKYDARVDILAPGEKIWTTGNRNDITGYGDFSDTSAATPHVSGVAGMLYSINNTLSGAEIKEIITNTHRGVKIERVNDNNEYYLLDAHNAIEGALSKGGGGAFPNGYTPPERIIVMGEVTFNRANDNTTQLLSNHTVEVYRITGGAHQRIDNNQLKTNSEGSFNIALPEGDYLIRVEVGRGNNPSVDSKEIKLQGRGAYLCNLHISDIPQTGISIANSKTKSAVSGTEIVNSLDYSRITTSDENGMFYLDLDDGVYNLIFFKDSYLHLEKTIEIINGVPYHNGEILEVVQMSTGWEINNDTVVISSNAGMSNWVYITDGRWERNQSIVNAVILPGVTYIGQGAFAGCSNLETVEIPDSVGGFSEWAFTDCTSLREITLPDSTRTIGRFAFQNTGLTSIVLPDSVIRIDSYAFSGNKNLTSVVISANVTNIAIYTFSGCDRLTSVTFNSQTPPTINPYAFFGAANLKTIYVPTGARPAYQAIPELKNYNIVEI
ncbi:MAG: leucine-rich repeat protein [Oscillospiraceae bacterium]|nr:leucine-rich repeat protein [Oscillospiraceae bacterium]